MKGLADKKITLVPNFILEYIMDQFAQENDFTYDIVDIASFSARSEALLNDQVEETYGGHTVVKTFNHEAADQVVFEEENDRLYSAGWKAQFISAIIMPLMNFI
ncbi:hypothetical protein KWH76_24250, partial [Enterobacter roggenkampii]|nr:hypothetical protein [Enterobacter roggenkampii]